MGLLLVCVAVALYVLAGLWFFFRGFEFFRAYNMKQGAPDSPRRQMFEAPQNRALILLFRGLGIFLIAAGVLFLTVMVWRHHF